MNAATPSTFQVRWYLSVAIALFIFVVVGWYCTRMADNASTYDQAQAQVRLKKLHDMQATDQKNLTTADWIDKDKGVVRIPIAEAMAQEVGVLKSKPVAAGAAIPAAAPAAPAAPAPAAPPAANPPEKK